MDVSPNEVILVPKSISTLYYLFKIRTFSVATIVLATFFIFDSDRIFLLILMQKKRKSHNRKSSCICFNKNLATSFTNVLLRYRWNQNLFHHHLLPHLLLLQIMQSLLVSFHLFALPLLQLQ